MAAFEEFQAPAVHRRGLQAVDEPEQRGPSPPEEFAEFVDERQHGGAHNDVIQHLGIAGDLGKIAGERCFRWRNGDMLQNLAALRGDRFGEEIPVIVAKGEIRVDHRDLLAQGRGHEGRHGPHLAFHIGDAGLQRVAVEHAGGHVTALGDDEIGQLQFPRPGGRPDDHVTEQRAEGDVAAMLAGEFLDQFGPAPGVSAVILGDDLHRAAMDAALVDQPGRGLRGAVITAAIGGPDTGTVHLKPAMRSGSLPWAPA